MKVLLALYILFISNILLQFTESQILTSLSSIKLVKPTDCNAITQYFDIARLDCKDCPANSKKFDFYNCKCNDDYFFTSNNGGGLIKCQKCPDNYIQSMDGFSCVICDEQCRSCPTLNGYRTNLNLDGTKFTTNGIPATQCVTCNAESSILSGKSCSSCKPLIFAESDTTSVDSLTCNQDYISLGGLLIASDSTYTVGDYFFQVTFGAELVESWYFRNNLIPSHRTCRKITRRNITSCQTLGNLCVLNMYSITSLTSLDACRSFTTIQRFQNLQDDNLAWGENIPWLTYPIAVSTYLTNYLGTGTSDNQYIKLNFDSKCKSSALSLYSADYSLTGEFLKYGPVDISKFQLCNYLTSTQSLASQISPFSATNYLQTCSITVSSLLEYGAKPIFFDLYLKYSNGSNLFPIPVKILNYKEVNNEVNRNGATSEQKLHRRFFLVDSVSTKSSESSLPKYVRYAKTIRLYFELIKDQNEGRIYPPMVIIDYGYVTTDNLDKTVPVTFQIEYAMNYDTTILGIWVTVGILGFFVFFWALIRAWVWNRRSGKLAPDMITLFKFAMFLFSGIANVFFLVLVSISIYWLLFYKGQGLAYVVLPTGIHEDTYKALVIVAFVLKLIDVLHLIFSQSSFDIFFIDWEKPKSDTSGIINNLIPSIKIGDKGKDDEKDKFIKSELKEYNKVSCWRTLFVANEWNEIQTFRKVDPTIQLICVLFFLKVINLEAITTADCNTSIVKDPNSYQASYSSILRVAMAASMYIGIGLVQYIAYIFIYIRCFQDKISQFVDFCSVSNISMFIMTHTQFGHYIHGRSPHGYADISMQQMTQALLKEQEDRTTKRGLGQNSDHQTFSILISNKLSSEYTKVMIPIFEKKGSRTTSGAFTSSEYEKRILAYSHLNKFLMGFIDNILRNLKYVIIKRNFVENILDLEFKDPLLNGYFYADDKKSFETALFFGQERKLFVFDLLTFLIVDFFAQNYILAAFIVYIVVKIYNTLRYDLGKRNISRKTLVDKRFLI